MLIKLLLILAISVVGRLVIGDLYVDIPQFMPDSNGYLTLSDQLAHTGTFIDGSGSSESKRTPGYPGLLALFQIFDLGLTWVVVFQHFLIILTAILVGWCISQRFNQSVGLTAAFLIAANFPLAVFSNFILTEVCFVFLITSAFCLLLLNDKTHEEGKKQAFTLLVVGLLTGFAVLVRPVALFLIIPMTFFVLFSYRTVFKNCLILIIAFSIVPTVWMTRNYNENGVFSISSISSINLLLYQGAGTLAIASDDDYDKAFSLYQSELRTKASAIVISREGTSLESKEKIQSSVYKEFFFDILRDYPFHAALHTSRNILLTSLGYATSQIVQLFEVTPNMAFIIALSASSFSMVLFWIGMLVCWRRDKKLAILSLLYCSYFIVIPALSGVGGTRFRLPVEPIICVGMAVGIHYLSQSRIVSRVFRERW